MRLSLAVCAVHKVATQKNLGIMGPQVVQAHVAGKRKKGAKKVRGPATHLMSDEQFYTYQSSIVVCCTQHTNTAQCVYVDTGTDTLGITNVYNFAMKAHTKDRKGQQTKSFTRAIRPGMSTAAPVALVKKSTPTNDTAAAASTSTTTTTTTTTTSTDQA
jgi:hypothetical protein